MGTFFSEENRQKEFSRGTLEESKGSDREDTRTILLRGRAKNFEEPTHNHKKKEEQPIKSPQITVYR